MTDDRLREAARPFVEYYKRQQEAYGARGGVLDRYPSAHPFRDIGARELPLGLWRALAAALDAEPEPGPNIPARCHSCGAVVITSAEPEPTPSDEERADKIDAEVRAALRDAYSKDSLRDYGMPDAGVASRTLRHLVAQALAAARAEQRERNAAWHESEAQKCRERLKEMTANPMRHERCREDGGLDYTMELAGWHDSCAAAIRNQQETDNA